MSALAFVAAFLGAGAAESATVKADAAGSGSGSSAAKPHRCACARACRGAACCCGRVEADHAAPTVRTPERFAKAAGSEFRRTPGFSDLPCGGPPDAPSGPGPGSVRVAVLGPTRPCFPPPPRFQGRPTPTLQTPAARPSDLDDPPEASSPA